ncbi:MAG: hypothetical protein GY701_07060 [Sulfitobacter sp.]|nr:hypothetical protein [Sulfitobacter sp.]
MVNGVTYEIDLAGFIRRPLENLRQLRDEGAEPSESSLAAYNTWRRTIRDWSMGAGQDWYDEDSSINDRSRFRASKNVDIWTDRSLGLLPSSVRTASLGSNGATGGLKRAGDTYVYGYVGGVGFHMTAAGTVTDCTGESGTFSDITTWDDYVYFAGSANLRRVQVGATAMATFGSLTPDLIEAVAGRLLAADGSALYEINASGAKRNGVDVFDHPSTNWTWSALEGAPNGIYASGDDGYTSTVFLVPVVDGTGDLVAPYPVLPLPPGEIVRDIKHLSSVMLVATNRGVRMCTVNGSGFLGMGPVITDLGDVKCLAVDGNYVYAGWSSDPIDSQVALARLGPDRWTEQLVPRYACDQNYADTGIVLACAVLDGQAFFLYDDEAAATYGVYGHLTEKASTGVLYTGGISYLTPNDKRFFSMEGSTDPIPAGGSATFALSDHIVGTAGFVLTMDATGQTEETAYDATPLEVEAGEVLITLTRAIDVTVDPVVHRLSMGSTPINFRTEEIILPVIIKESVGGESMVIDAEWEALHVLFLSQERVTLIFGSKTETVTVDAVATEPTNAVEGAVDWNMAHEWPQGTWLVRLLTQEA